MKSKAILLFLFLSMLIGTAKACEITLGVESQTKESYNTGDEIIIKVEVVFSHRACPVAIKDTKFTFDGAKFLGATEWKEVKAGSYTRKVKLKVEQDGKQEIKLTAKRTCEKDGGFASIKLKKQN